MWRKYSDGSRNHVGSQSESSTVRLEDTPDGRVSHFGGYQQFTLTEHTVVPHTKQPKYAAVARALEKIGIRGKTLSDVGSNNGVIAYIAMTLGASRSLALDHDTECLANIAAANRHLGISNVHPIEFDFRDTDSHGQSDIVIAMALVHWVYSCTSNYGCLTKIVERLCSMCTEYLIVEWIAPDDAAIQLFRHTDFNAGARKEPYTTENFERAIRANGCTVVEVLPTETHTRTTYVLSRTSAE